MDELRELVIRRRIELGTPGKPLAFKQVALRSGGRISHEIIRQIEMGRRPARMSDEKLEGLAAALGVQPSVVYEAAKVPRPGTRWRWPERFDRLPEEDRRLVEALAAKLVALRELAERGA